MQPLHILLIAPHQPESSRIISLSKGVTPPIGIAYIAGFLIKNGFNVKILDNELEQLDWDELRLYIRGVRPLCVGISASTISVGNACRIAAIVKDVDRDIKVILGGVHPSALPDAVLAHEAVDVVVKGEGEQATGELLNAFNSRSGLEGIRGIAYKDNGSIKHTPARDLVADIDVFPMPAYELLPMSRYYGYASRGSTNKRIGTVITGRGCPYQCVFCSHNRTLFQSKVRLRSPQNIIEEMQYLIDHYNVGEFMVCDDSFTMDIERVREICRLIRINNLNITWSCNSRVDRAVPQLYADLFSSGCRSMLFGAESGSQIILDSLKKNVTLGQIEASVRLCRQYKMSSICTFMIGCPGDTVETIRQTLAFVKKIQPDMVQYCMFMPLPGSEIFDIAVARGLVDIKTADWDQYQTLLSSMRPPVNMSSISQDELIWWLKKGSREFFLDPRYIFKNVLKIRSFAHFAELWRGFTAVAGHQLCKFESDRIRTGGKGIKRRI